MSSFLLYIPLLNQRPPHIFIIYGVEKLEPKRKNLKFLCVTDVLFKGEKGPWRNQNTPPNLKQRRGWPTREKVEAGFPQTPDLNSNYAHGLRILRCLEITPQQMNNLGFFHLRGRSPKIRGGIWLVIPLVFQGRNRFCFLTTVNLSLDPFLGWRRGFSFWITLGFLWRFGVHRNRVTPLDSKKLYLYLSGHGSLGIKGGLFGRKYGMWSLLGGLNEWVKNTCGKIHLLTLGKKIGYDTRSSSRPKLVFRKNFQYPLFEVAIIRKRISSFIMISRSCSGLDKINLVRGWPVLPNRLAFD